MEENINRNWRKVWN